MKKFSIITTALGVLIFMGITMLSILQLKQPEFEKGYKVDNAEIYNR